MSDHNSIHSIVEKLRLIESEITPVTVRQGLNRQQRSVPQLPALFKPKSISVLKSKTDPKHPMSGYAVGGCEESAGSAETTRAREQGGRDGYYHRAKNNPYQAGTKDHEEYNRGYDEFYKDKQYNEDKILDRVKRSFADYLTSIEQKYRDDNIRDQAKDRELGTKDKKDRDLIARDLDEDPTQDDSSEQETAPAQMESAPVKTVTNECGIWEMHGNEHDGFEVRRQGRALPTKFRSLDEAEMAVEMFLSRRQAHDQSADYLEEK